MLSIQNRVSKPRRHVLAGLFALMTACVFLAPAKRAQSGDDPNKCTPREKASDGTSLKPIPDDLCKYKAQENENCCTPEGGGEEVCCPPDQIPNFAQPVHTNFYACSVSAPGYPLVVKSGD